ncbi:hypothetical protein LCGC14_0858540 [marine sediment metagenome]|uniref:Tetratricopeptide repeat-containing protein n=2 Tax=root TaxID=1 RepID=A0A831VPB2_9FLAO|nr:hypothetical protein [Pricia sp.]HEA21811.1 hypothetical protein [Pricia antarctica]
MKNILRMSLLIVPLILNAQSQYGESMQKAMKLREERKTEEASNLFERIALLENVNWLPSCYSDLVNTTACFGEKDKKQLTEGLEKAKESIDIAKNLSPDNTELLIKETMINTAWIVFDGATNGMTLSGENSQLYQKALQLAPENPRVVFSKAEWDMDSDRYYGKDMAPYGKDVERSLQLFVNFKPDGQS